MSYKSKNTLTSNVWLDSIHSLDERIPYLVVGWTYLRCIRAYFERKTESKWADGLIRARQYVLKWADFKTQNGSHFSRGKKSISIAIGLVRENVLYHNTKMICCTWNTLKKNRFPIDRELPRSRATTYRLDYQRNSLNHNSLSPCNQCNPEWFGQFYLFHRFGHGCVCVSSNLILNELIIGSLLNIIRIWIKKFENILPHIYACETPFAEKKKMKLWLTFRWRD